LSIALIDEIRDRIEAEQFELSKHAVDRSIIPRISVQESREIFGDAELIEDLSRGQIRTKLFDRGEDQRRKTTAYSMQLSVPATYQIITIYESDPDLWIDFKMRRTS
jgi:hypothetical protein